MKRKLFLILICVISASMIITGCKNSTDDGVPENTDIREEEPRVEKTIFDKDFMKIYKLSNDNLKILMNGDELTAEYDSKRDFKKDFVENDIEYLDEYKNRYIITEETNEFVGFDLNGSYIDYLAAKDENIRQVSNEEIEIILNDFIETMGIDISQYNNTVKRSDGWKYYFEYDKWISGIQTRSMIYIDINKYGMVSVYNGKFVNEFDKYNDKVIDKDYYFNQTEQQLELEEGYLYDLSLDYLYISKDKKNLIVAVYVEIYENQLFKDNKIIDNTLYYSYIIE